ncbi:hypothetical protein, partial [Enterobacter asburiae]
HGDVLMWLMKTLLTSGCTNQRGAGQLSRGLWRRVHLGQLMRNSKPMKAQKIAPIPAMPIINQTRIVPMVAITLTSLLFVSDNSPATLCYAPGCLSSSGGP